jgi:AmmeMemoRadiSam system protein A
MSRLSEKPLQKTASPAESHPAVSPEFSFEQRRELLRIAREAILFVFNPQSVPETSPVANWLFEPRGIFTTLYLNHDPAHSLDHQLRGCVGYAMPVAPLGRAVAETARAAAFDDSRFLPLTGEELASLEISLSILSPLVPIHPDEVKVGRHGLLISAGAHRGLLLPQVPLENGWDREAFLRQTCVKAGLPQNAWREGATIQAFAAEVFGDMDVRVPS